MPRYNRPRVAGEPQFAYFGQALRYYRESYHERERAARAGSIEAVAAMEALERQMAQDAGAPPPEPRVLPALQLLPRLAARGYKISSGSYSEIESGVSLPKDPGMFFDAVTFCLLLPEGSPGWQTLLTHLAYDYFERKFRPEYTRYVLR